MLDGVRVILGQSIGLSTRIAGRDSIPADVGYRGPRSDYRSIHPEKGAGAAMSDGNGRLWGRLLVHLHG